MQLKYRTDIDGLRAVAVLSVILFHSGVSMFSGGYVGVDIFFVISGYLITTIIVREIGSNEFSISRFYERRFRRILPALTVVVSASLVAGHFLLTPDALVELGQSALTTALFSSNVLFYFESGYFDGPAEIKPLLHTWSLAVEEQYYIFFPLLLMLIAKFGTRHYLKWLSILGLLSLIACVIVTTIDSSAAFYLIPTRAWELFLGSIIALHVFPNPKNKYVREALSFTGAGLIALSIFHFTANTDFPGKAAVIPTLGSALIIYSGLGGQSAVARFLSLRPIVFIGLISYSLYLWHWPIIVYTKIYSINVPGNQTIAAMILAIFVISVISWRYVETPFRNKFLLERKQSLLGVSALTSIVIVVVGVVIVLSDGLPKRYESIIDDGLKTTDLEWEHWGACEQVIDKIRKNQDLCPIGASENNTRFILWGDSHARALAPGIDLSAKNHDIKGLIATQSACPPLIEIERPGRRSCQDFNDLVIKLISENPEIETVILAARWALSTKGDRYKQEAGKSVRLIDVGSHGELNLSNLELFDLGLSRTIKKLHELGRTVVLIHPVPEVGIDVPTSYFVAEITGRNIEQIVSPTLQEFRQRTMEVTSVFSRLKNDRKVRIVEPASHLCTASHCRVTHQGILLYRDDDHLSTFGSKHIHPIYNPIFKSLAPN